MSLRKRRENKGLNFEVNIVPIVDAMTILIIFLLASGAFISLGVIDIGIAAPGETLLKEKPPKIEVKVQLQKDKDILVHITGEMRKTYQMSSLNGGWDHPKLKDRLTQIKERFPEVKSAEVISHMEVSYQDVISAAEVVRQTHGAVSLGGF